MRTAAVVVVLLAIPHAALAQPPQDGMNLSWGNCLLTSSNHNLNFACDDNATTKRLVCSFRLASAMPNFVGVSATVRFQVGAGSPMPWWAFGPGECREGAFAAAPVPPILSGCLSPYEGPQDGGSVVDRLGTNRWEIRADWARETGFDLAAATLYAGLVLVLTTEKSYDDGFGVGVCEGCDRQACFSLHQLAAYWGVDSSSYGWVEISSPHIRDFVTYQGADYSGYYCVTPARPSTWGAVKALYR